MWQKIKDLSTMAKVGIISGLALLAAGGIGLGIWQPWNRPEETPDEPDVQQQEPAESQQKSPEEQLSLQVNGEKVPCTLHEGDGWSVYLPEDWTAEPLGNDGMLFSSGDGAQMSVRFGGDAGYTGTYVNLSASGNDMMLEFYRGANGNSLFLEGNAPKANWEQYNKLFVALARTLTVGDEKPFAESYIIPEEPDWQKAEGDTVLFLDKDGYIVDDKAQEAIEDFMKSWPVEAQEIYTGQYRINSLEWASSYTGITKDGYIDVFRADVQYRVREGANPEGVNVVNGWASVGDSIYLAISHDGGSVRKTTGVPTGLEDGWAGFAAAIA